MLARNVITNYERIKEIFAVAVELAPAERGKFLDENCLDEFSRGEVESLLKAREQAGDFLENLSAVAVVQNSFEKNENNNLINQKIDKYRILREIGRGGMGVVYLAAREDFHQQVALKIIKRGMDSDAILERFKREREILAALVHPFITRLLDGGTTEEGTPYFVMECVEGTPLDEYCRNSELSEKEKLELFRKICAAVSFAHQKLVVHRDLKPSNILVTSEGEPKLLDFGIAKLLNSTDGDNTQTNQRVLTPAYASPEHLRGEIVGTTSDVYSLGVILTELLGVDKKRLETQNSSTIQHLNKDLRNILVKSLRGDAACRYQSVEQLGEDIRRYLAGLPITARKDSAVYRLTKFVQRNRIAAAIALLFAASLIGGFAATLWQKREAERERLLAEHRFDNLRKLSNSLVTEIYGAIQNLPGSLPARQLMLKRALEQLDALAEEAGDNTDLEDELATAYYNLAQLPDMPPRRTRTSIE